MNATNPLSSDEIEKSSEVEGKRDIRERERVERDDLKVSNEKLAASVLRLSDGAICEIDQLINQLQKLRSRLKSAGDRIQGDIAGYTELSRQTMQLTSIIAESVRKLPPGTR